jgi:hypothetical protein
VSEVIGDLANLADRTDGVQLTTAYEASLLAELLLLDRSALENVLIWTKEDILCVLLGGSKTILE